MKQVANRHNGMMKDHAGAGEPHDLSNLFPHLWFIAMNRALLACGFSIPEQTLFKAFIRVFEEFPTLLTEGVRMVVQLAVQVNHGLHCFSFVL
jgi:hypothetical protein